MSAPNLKFNLRKKALLTLAIPLIVQLCFLALMAILLKQADTEIAREARLRDLFSRTATLNNAIYEATVALSIYNSNSNPIAKSQFDESIARVDQLSLEVQNLAGHTYSDFAGKVRKITGDATKELGDAKFAIDQHTSDVSQFHTRHLMKTIRGLSEKLRSETDAFAAGFSKNPDVSFQQAEMARNSLAMILLIGFAVLVILTGIATAYFVRGLTRRLDVITDNSFRLAAGQPLNPPLKGKDEIDYLDNVFHDMSTAIAEAAKKERAIVENSADIICSIDSDGKFIAVSPSCARIWGFEPQELLGRNFIGLIENEQRDSTIEEVQKATNTGETRIIANRVIKKDGFPVDMSWSLSWVGEERALFCVARDITEQKKLERLKEEFVAMVSHDLRTPLSSLLLFLPMLGEGMIEGVPPKVVKWANDASNEVGRLIQLVNSLLDIAKMESGRIKLTLAPAEVATIVERSILAVETLAGGQNIKIMRVDTKAIVFGDQDRLIQVLVNLLSNAIQYSPAGASIAIRVVREGEFIAIKVTDQGPGIPDADQSRIFDRFEQAKAATGRVKGAAGLGLAICKTIIEEHKGKIGVASEVGHGSTFWFKVPSYSEEIEEDSTSSPSENESQCNSSRQPTATEG